MALNDVLNRPLFRQQALKKGALKPAKARVGQFIRGSGFSMNPIATQNVSNFNPRNVPMVVEQPGMFSRTGQFFKRLGSDIRNFPSTAGQQLMQPRTKVPFGLGGGLGGLLGAEGLYQASSGLTTKLGMQPGTAKTIVDLGLTTAGMFNPYTRALGLGITGLRAARGILGGAADYVTGQPIGTTSQKFQVNLGDPLFANAFTPIDPTQPRLNRKQRRDLKKLEAKAREEGSEAALTGTTKSVDVATLPQNTTDINNKKVIDTAKISENAVKNTNVIDGGLTGPVGAEPGGPMNPIPTVPERVIVEKESDAFGFPKPTTKGQKESATLQADKDSIDAESPMMKAIKDAKLMAAEMRKGTASQAQLAFLSNLATGLLTGTTTKSGVAGALEVAGKALGPAVNNSILIKMKEDEIDQNLLGRALDFQADFLKAQNDAFEMPDTLEAGVIQVPNANGRIVNVPGRILKDGTKQRATGQVDSRGMNIYVTVDPSLNFIANKDQNKETLDLAKEIGGKYAAVNLINKSLGIITSGDAQAGVTGAIGLYGGRLTEALGDVFKFAKPGGNTKAELLKSGETMFDIEQNNAAVRLVNSGEFETKEEALNYLNRNLGNFNKNYNSALRNAKKRLKDGSTLDYERLAINETVLVYKLANSLKSKDRLTQKDIEMAKGLVKVFPLLRGELNVIATLTATAETILDDIKQQERLYERAGGDSNYLLQERKAYGLISPEQNLGNMLDFESKEFRSLQERLKTMTEEDFKKIFPPELFG